jgi:hypothetical protein
MSAPRPTPPLIGGTLYWVQNYHLSREWVAKCWSCQISMRTNQDLSRRSRLLALWRGKKSSSFEMRQGVCIWVQPERKNNAADPHTGETGTESVPSPKRPPRKRAAAATKKPPTPKARSSRPIKNSMRIAFLLGEMSRIAYHFTYRRNSISGTKKSTDNLPA